MRPMYLKRALASIPSNAHVEVVQPSSPGSGVARQRQYIPVSLLAAQVDIDTFAELQALVADATLVAEPSGDFLLPRFPKGAPQALSGAGAVTLTEYCTNFTSTGAGEALTLADGTQLGQVKRVVHVVDGGDGVLTPANFADGTTITFTTAGEFANLIWDGTNWNVFDLGNITAGGAAPAVA